MFWFPYKTFWFLGKFFSSNFHTKLFRFGQVFFVFGHIQSFFGLGFRVCFSGSSSQGKWLWFWFSRYGSGFHTQAFLVLVSRVSGFGFQGEHATHTNMK